MQKKVFICLDKQFPRKNASANYVEYLGKAIQDGNTNVYVISISEKRSECGQWVNYQHMQYCNVYYDVAKPVDTLRTRLKVGLDIWNKIEQQNIDEGDIIICYSDNFFLLKTIYKKSKLKGARVVNCVTEWHIAKQYKYGYFDIFNYWYYCLGFYKGIGCSKNVISVSRKLEKHFQQKRCRSFVLPPLTDPYEFQYNKEKCDDKIRFIYSGQFGKKDSMWIMLSALAALKDSDRKQMEFHVTGCNRLKLTEIINELPEEKNKKIIDYIVWHEWMPYKELINLYNQMHFLLIARPENRVTQSNFPSKIPEMMGYGIIPVMNKVGDCPEYYLMDGEDSILFNLCNVKECSEAISRAIALSSEQRTYMQRCVREKAENVFYYKKWSKHICKFLFDGGV